MTNVISSLGSCDSQTVDFYFKKQSGFEAHAFTFCPRIFDNYFTGVNSFMPVMKTFPM